MAAETVKTKGARRIWRWLVAGGVVVAAVVAVILIRQAMRPGPDAPNFVLRDQQGRLTSLAQFRGKVVVLTFIDPDCVQICPLTTQSMLRAVSMLSPQAAAQVQLLGINVNAAQNSVADVEHYSEIHGLSGNWRFLTGTPDQLARVWKAYDIHVAVVNGDIQHEAVMLVIDRDGYERYLEATPMSYGAVGDQAETLATAVAKLLPGHPAIADAGAGVGGAASQPPPGPPPGPNDTLHLANLAAGGEPVLLGGPHPHLVLFFASWLAPGPELGEKLAGLDSYAALARRHGWPSPVAADVLTTEPSPEAARRQLAGLAAKLQTPIVADDSGNLADDYHVGDLPWYVLTGANGDIVWRHDGWLDAAELNREVTAAMAARTSSGTHP